MFDLALAHIHRAEQERDLAADLRARQILKATVASSAVEPSAAAVPSNTRPAPAARPGTRVRALGR